MEMIFGDFVDVLNDFAVGRSTPPEFRDRVADQVVNFVYVFVGRSCGSFLHTSFLTIAATRITKTIRQRFLEATLSQDIAYFDGEGRGSIAIQTTTNGNLIQLGMAERLGLTIQACATFVAAFIVAFLAQWKLTLITLSIVPIILILTIVMSGIDAAIEANILDLYAQAGTLAEDVIASIKNVKAFWMMPQLVLKYDKYLEKAHEHGNKKSSVYGVLFSVEFFMIYVGYTLAFWRGIHMFVNGEIHGPGAIMVVLFSVVIAASSLTQITPYFSSFARAASAAKELFKIIDRPSSLDPFNSRGCIPKAIFGDISFSNVDFTYPTRPDVRVLTQFSLNFPAGKTTALVGPSGSGKSTVIGLLERWYRPLAGQITLDGKSIDSLDVNWLRTNIRLVQQEPVLFSGTIFDNVCYGIVGTQWEQESREQLMHRVVEACKIANAHGFVSDLPDGYETHVGERAGLLSGGQKQRLTIARAIISDPKILLLDEATSALDPHAEGIVQQALDKASVNRTTIVIAHKLATIKRAHNIVVISKGVIVEQGTHEQLLGKDGAYARLVYAQDLETATERKHDDTDGYTEEHGDTEKETLGNVLTTGSMAAGISNAREQQAMLDYASHNRLSTWTIILSVVHEHRSLRVWFIFVIFACLAGGMLIRSEPSC
ncbi:hypothetical protein Plec18170_009167 [Paecilomyces lecythidis]